MNFAAEQTDHALELGAENRNPNQAATSSAGNQHDPNCRRSWWRRLRDSLWGYDFFISYHWATGGAYAVNLAQKLRSLKYDVFLDRADYASGDDWRKIGEIALRNTQRLVLIATREAVTISDPVRHEIEIFTSRDRQVIAIVFGDTFDDLNRQMYPTLTCLPNSKLFIDSGAISLKSGPSDTTLAELIRTHKVLRRRNLRALLTLVPAILVITFAVFMTFSWARATIAEENAKVAAKEAENSRNNAVEQRNIAKQKLADSLYIQSQAASEQRHDWQAALLFACQAADAAPDKDKRLPVYLDRIFQIVEQAPTHVTNLPIEGAVESASFSPKFDRLAVVNVNRVVELFRVSDGTKLKIPDIVSTPGDAGKFPPRFSSAGDRVLAATAWREPEPDPDEPATAALLKVWNCDDGTPLTTLLDTHPRWDELPSSYFRVPSLFPVFSSDGREVFDITSTGGALCVLWQDKDLTNSKFNSSAAGYANSEDGKLPPIVNGALGISKNPNHHNIISASNNSDLKSGVVDIVNTRSGESVFANKEPLTIPGLITSAALSRNAETLLAAWVNQEKAFAGRFDVQSDRPAPIGEPIEIQTPVTSYHNLILPKFADVDEAGKRALLVCYGKETESPDGAALVDFDKKCAVEFPSDLKPELMSLADDGSAVLITNAPDGVELTSWKDGSLQLHRQIPALRGIQIASDHSFAATVDRMGTVMFWPLLPLAQRDAKFITDPNFYDPFNVVDIAKWSADGRRLATVSPLGLLQMWRVCENENIELLWSKELPSGTGPDAKLRFDRTGEHVVVCESGRSSNNFQMCAYATETGETYLKGRNGLNFGRDDYDLKDLSFLPDGDEFVVVTEYNTDDNHIRALRFQAVPLQGATLETNWTRQNFMSLVGDGQHALIGNNYQELLSSFEIQRVDSGKTIARLRFPSTARMNGRCMLALLQTATQLSAVNDHEIHLTLDNGPQISLSTAGDEETRCTVLSSGNPVASPKLATLFQAIIAVSRNGRWIAAARENTAQVFDATTGDPMSEPFVFASRLQALSFTHDSSKLRIVDASGKLSTFVIHVDWVGQPEWLTNLAKGVTGCKFNSFQRITRMSLKEAASARATLITQLKSDAAKNPAAAAILNRLEKQSE